MKNSHIKNKAVVFGAAVVFLLLASTTLNAQVLPYTPEQLACNYNQPVLPAGMQRNIVSTEQLDPEQCGWGDPQIRQSEVLVGKYTEERNGEDALVGTEEVFMLYCGALVQTHNLDLIGSVNYVFTDDTTYTINNYHWIWVWSTLSPGLPLVFVITVDTSWMYKECKKITYDVNYLEDGLYVRHIHHVWRDWSYYPVEFKSVEMTQPQFLNTMNTQIFEIL